MLEPHPTLQHPHLGATHSWLNKITISYVPGPSTPLIEVVVKHLLEQFQLHGHTVLAEPSQPPGPDVILTSTLFGQPLDWHRSLTLTARRRYHLDHHPTVFNLLHARPAQWQALIDRLQRALEKEPADPADFDFPGMAKLAYHTLYEQGRRGGPIMSIARIIQSQAMSIRNIVVIGEETPQAAYTFDLVGAHPRSDGAAGPDFYVDLMLRILTATCTHEITNHSIESAKIPLDLWQSLSTPHAMKNAGKEFGRVGFFTEMVKVANLVDVPLLDQAISSQYSEGCYATWDPVLNALVCTITGSARPVEKDNLTDDELAVISRIREDGKGACVRHVEGKRNDPPSSEAVEMLEMDAVLPRIRLDEGWPQQVEVPVARSKLHGHRGVRSYDPARVEHVYLEPPYYSYPVSCSTEAQARAIQGAFARSQALQNPDDPRQVVFTVLPGHGVLIAEKWVAGKAPFEVICQTIADGLLEIENEVPQGPLTFQPGPDGRQVLRMPGA